MARRRFTAEYKQEAVVLVQQSDIPVAEIARNLGLHDNLLRRWVKEQADPVKRSFPGQGNPRDEEVTRLKRELLQVKKERDFLKEAAAYFAKNSK